MLPGGDPTGLLHTAQYSEANCREWEALPHHQNTSQRPIQEVPSTPTKK